MPRLQPKFLSPFRAEQIDERDWLLTAPFVYQCERLDRVVTVAEGFVTDFASVPRLPLVYWLTAGIAVRASVVHDWFYRGGEAVTRADADAVFFEIMKLTGYWYWRRWIMWINLRIFGWIAWKANHATSGMGNAKAKAVTVAAENPQATTAEVKAIVLAPPVPAAASLASAAQPDAKHQEPKIEIPPMPDPVPPSLVDDLPPGGAS